MEPFAIPTWAGTVLVAAAVKPWVSGGRTVSGRVAFVVGQREAGASEERCGRQCPHLIEAGVDPDEDGRDAGVSHQHVRGRSVCRQAGSLSRWAGRSCGWPGDRR